MLRIINDERGAAGPLVPELLPDGFLPDDVTPRRDGDPFRGGALMLALSHGSGNYLETQSGRLIYIPEPDPADFDFDDIVEGLTKIPRFCGQTPGVFYCVAQHSVHVADVLLSTLPESRKTLKICFAGLFHDSPEAYLGDTPAPIKEHYGRSVRQIEERFQRAIFKRYEIDFPLGLPEEVIEADLRMRATERRDLQPNANPRLICEAKPYDFHITPWKPEEAAYRFRTKYRAILDRLERVSR